MSSTTLATILSDFVEELRDVTPGSAMNDLQHNRGRDRVIGCDIDNPMPVTVPSTNNLDISSRQLGPRMVFTPRTTSLARAIAVIVALRSCPKMYRIATDAVVAMMEHIWPLSRRIARCEAISDTVRHLGLWTTVVRATIAVWMNVSCPRPTGVFTCSLVYASPKEFVSATLMESDSALRHLRTIPTWGA